MGAIKFTLADDPVVTGLTTTLVLLSCMVQNHVWRFPIVMIGDYSRVFGDADFIFDINFPFLCASKSTLF